MATDELPDGLPLERHAVVFGLFPGDPKFYTIVERDSDNSGAPAGSAVIVAWLAPGERYYIEERNATEAFSHYRFKHGGFGFDFGEPTAWYRARPVAWNGEIPNIPREPLLDLDLDLDGTNGFVDIFANGGTRVRSISWDYATDTYPADATINEDTDAQGDVLIEDAFYLLPGETGYVTVEYYDQPGSIGNLLGTLRASVRYLLGEFTVPTIKEVRSESATEGSLTLVVNDPDGLVTQVRFRTKSGPNAWSDWFEDTSIPYGPWTVTLDSKHISFIEYEVTYVLGGVTYIIESSVAYDTDLVPELLTLTAHVGQYFEPFGVTRSVEIDYSGDSDVGSVRWAVSTSTYPDRTTTQSGTVNAGREDFDVEVLAAASSFVNVYVSLLAYTGVDGTGDESTFLYTAILEANIGDPDAIGPIILNCEFDEGDPGEGSYWATASTSTGVAISDSPTVGAGVDFDFDGDSQNVLLVQVVDADDDITKAITV